MKNLQEIEEDYQKVKSDFRKEDNLEAAYRIAGQIKDYEEILREVFAFLISAFRGKFRNDKKTPLVFHSIYLVRLASLYEEKNLDTLLTAALHDVLEDTNVSEDMLMKQEFMNGKSHLIKNLLALKENTGLSRDPDGKNLPPRYEEHIKRLIRGPKEVINTEIIDRFSDMMDLEYILKLPEGERNLRLKAKMIKVRCFVQNITKNRDDLNVNFLNLFESKARELEKKWGIKVEIPLITKK